MWIMSKRYPPEHRARQAILLDDDVEQRRIPVQVAVVGLPSGAGVDDGQLTLESTSACTTVMRAGTQPPHRRSG
jgi:hypothetical protein